MPKTLTVGLVGNPNCGKTTLFNALTGARHKVANWSGVTVEKREGTARFGDYNIRIIDLPGIYSLSAYTMEEIIARDYILDEKPDLIINVVDAGNLERNLYLTTQLINLGVRTVLALNMYDEAKKKGLDVDGEALGTLLGMPVIKTVGTRSEGLEDLLRTIIEVSEKKDGKTRYIHIPYGSDIEEEIAKIQAQIRKIPGAQGRYSTRWLAIRLIEGDEDAAKKLRAFEGFENVLSQAERSRRFMEAAYRDDIGTVLSERRYGFISGALRETVSAALTDRIDITEKIDRVIANRYLGFPILFLFLWVLFQMTFTLGEYPKTLLERGIALLGDFTASLLPPGPVKDLLTRGIIPGVGGVMVFLPNILILFMGISFMEDTGYMARAAFIMDKIMHRLGLHGKSFIPLIMGIGCNVPAIMATRSLENRQDRLLTILINPFMSCSARLPVYVLFAGLFFYDKAGVIILSLYMTGLLLAFLSARLFKHFFFKGVSTPFVMELPPYRMPTARTILLHMWDRSSQYLRKMGGIILAFSVIIWFLGEYPKAGEVLKVYDQKLAVLETGHQERLAELTEREGIGEKVRIENSRYAAERERLLMQKNAEEHRHTVIGRFGDIIYPVIRPLGFNWQMGIALSTGFVAKEVVISTLGVLYQTEGEKESESRTSLKRGLLHPEYGISPLSAYVFMLFVLLYVPCLATVVVIGREAGWGWAAFSIFYQLLVAWLVCFLVYRAGLLLGLA